MTTKTSNNSAAGPPKEPGKSKKAAGTSTVQGSRLARPVFIPAAAVIVVFVAYALVQPKAASALFAGLQENVIGAFGWYYVLLVAFFVAFSLWMGFSRYGDIPLGKDNDKPEFSLMSWFALLFAAGMGIGLVFWGVAEPLNHFASPRPGVTGTDIQLGQQAITQTFLHWGLHAWSIYVVVGLAIAYAVHRRGRPISIRWTLEPLLGKKVRGAWGHAIDVIALVGTLFGVATSLGLGVLQISAGLDTSGIMAATQSTQIGLILCITTLTIISVVSGVGRGMKWLSNINLVLAAVLLMVVLFAGPTLFLLREFVQSIGHYLQNVLGLTFNTLAFSGAEGEAWQGAWTTFYWGWWMSWAPFVGIFIARISKGRTVREFVAGVLLVPTLVGFLWFSVLGGSAIYREIFGQGGLIGPDGVDTENALFALLGDLPGGPVLMIGAILLIAIFFITSADSGALVMSMISTGGDAHPKNWIRVFWAVLAAAVAISLLLVGTEGLASIQTAAILTALPFSVVMLLMCIATARAFHGEHRAFLAAQRKVAQTIMVERIHGQVAERVSDQVADQVAETMSEEVERQIQEHFTEHGAELAVVISPETPAKGSPAVSKATKSAAASDPDEPLTGKSPR
ncbi:BCCT family transporter [Pseudarthrobacter sp. J75]|uniref:BCCT family transporter n=1 Tax=unclassified Pseudarthrobacter TaxID=2647000 RepID=UPI002E80131D|nr:MULTISPECIES: BCCT family transporter [unclassified Pseudarthrobacter]MEE2524251.1 BCCT family transporter [Pseudarthrobacter sp. J47]MEE2530153.1 BCCT family transporter [Pseudarthrobacter sp. J75]MEE2568977.1 BCCT family transporter [Pseudarthrobacter sp. J64]